LGLTKQLSLADIIKAEDHIDEKVPTPEWGEGTYITIRSMTGEARDAYEMTLFAMDKTGEYKQDLSNARAKLIAACAIGPDGKRMFTSDDHIKALGSKNNAVIDRIWQACQNLNSIGKEQIDELLGN